MTDIHALIKDNSKVDTLLEIANGLIDLLDAAGVYYDDTEQMFVYGAKGDHDAEVIKFEALKEMLRHRLCADGDVTPMVRDHVDWDGVCNSWIDNEGLALADPEPAGDVRYVVVPPNAYRWLMRGPGINAINIGRV